MVVNVPASNKFTLLQQIERKGIRVETQCREGFCGACRTTLVSGQVSYTEQPLAYAGAGEVILCCAMATTEVTLNV